MTGWENPISLIFEGVGTALGRLLGLVLACWIGCAIAVASVDQSNHPLPLGCTPFAVPVYWFGGIFVGMAQGWGFLAYLALFLLAASLVPSERVSWWVLASATLIQAAETQRMLVAWGVPVRWWVYGPLLTLVLAASGGAWWLGKKAEAQRRERRSRRRRGYCVECGYDLRATIRAGNTECPECGAEIPLFTITSVESMDRGESPHESPAA